MRLRSGKELTLAQVSVSEARARLTRLVREVGAGATFVVTKRGKPVTRIVPVDMREHNDAGEAVDGLREARRGLSLGGLSWRELRDEGRR